MKNLKNSNIKRWRNFHIFGHTSKKRLTRMGDLDEIFRDDIFLCWLVSFCNAFFIGEIRLSAWEWQSAYPESRHANRAAAVCSLKQHLQRKNKRICSPKSSKMMNLSKIACKFSFFIVMIYLAQAALSWWYTVFNKDCGLLGLKHEVTSLVEIPNKSPITTNGKVQRSQARENNVALITKDAMKKKEILPKLERVWLFDMRYCSVFFWFSSELR